MEAINIRHKCDIFSKKAVVFFLLLASSYGFAQQTKVLNLQHYDDKAIHYGFHLGLNSTSFRVRASDDINGHATIASVNGGLSSGFNLGFVINIRLTDYLDARILPTVAFYSRTVEFNYLDNSQVKYFYESTFTEFPLLIKYKSERRGNNRMYIVAGIKPGIEVGAKKREKKSTQLRTKSFDMSIELGIGSDFYFEMFKFAPEIRFSLGLRNLLIKDDNEFSEVLSGLPTYSITFVTLFE